MDTGIPQGSSVSPILFLIYLSGMFTEVEEAAPGITSLSFVDDLGFIVEGGSAAEIVTTLETVSKAVIQWGLENAVSYDVDKTEAVLFTKAKAINRRRMIRGFKVKIEFKKIFFNEDATRWLGVFIDSGLQLRAHFEHRMKKAKAAEARLRGIVGTYGLAFGLVRRIQIAAVQATALYDAELWWKGQTKQEKEMQKLMNRQARAITGMFRSTPEALIVREAGLTSAKALLNARQRGYGGRLLSLPDGHPIKEILSITLRKGDEAAQPGEQSIDDNEWAEGRGQNTLGHYLARQLAVQGAIDPAEGIEPIVKIRSETFPGEVIISPTEQALEEAREPRSGLVLWSDGSRLEHEGVEAAAA